MSLLRPQLPVQRRILEAFIRQRGQAHRHRIILEPVAYMDITQPANRSKSPKPAIRRRWIRFRTRPPLRTAAEPAQARTAAHDKREPTLLTRTVRYRYVEINGRSLLSEIDGPLPNGPTNSPKDSDVTRLEWDGRGSYPVSIIKPGNLFSRIETREAAGRASAVHEVTGVLTQIQYAYTRPATRMTGGMRQRNEIVHQPSCWSLLWTYRDWLLLKMEPAQSLADFELEAGTLAHALQLAV